MRRSLLPTVGFNEAGIVPVDIQVARVDFNFIDDEGNGIDAFLVRTTINGATGEFWARRRGGSPHSRWTSCVY